MNKSKVLQKLAKNGAAWMFGSQAFATDPEGCYKKAFEFAIATAEPCDKKGDK